MFPATSTPRSTQARHPARAHASARITFSGVLAAGLCLLAPPSSATPQAARFCPQASVRSAQVDPGDDFGLALGTDGTRLAVGSRYDGAITVYRQSGRNWFEEARVPYAGQTRGLFFGEHVAIEGDLLVSSTPTEPPPNAGRVQIHEWSGSAWDVAFEVAASDDNPNARFGEAIATDGQRVFAGAVGVPSSQFGSSNQGAVYVFEKSGSSWIETQRITPSDPGNSDYFGSSIAVWGDLLVIGTPEDNTPGGFINTGSVYVFRDGPSGFVEEQKLVGTGLVQSSDFGRAVAVEGTTILVGAPVHTNLTISAEGAAYVFEQQAGTWVETQMLQAQDPFARDLFGSQVALAGDTAIITAPGRSEATGAAYVFERAGGLWSESGLLDHPNARNRDQLGVSLGLTDSLAILGAPGHGPGGAVEVFALDGTCRTFSAFPRTVPLSRGGKHVMTVDAGPALAGLPYLIAGTSSGTSPGFTVAGTRVPLVPDPWFGLTLNSGASKLWSQGAGVLDANGQAVAWLDLPPVDDPALLGFELNHVAAVFSETGALLHVSNSTSLQVTP